MRLNVRLLLVPVLALLIVGPAVSGLGNGGGAPDAALVGAWDAPFEGEAPAVSMALLADGRVLYWSGVEANEAISDPTYLTFFTGTPVEAESRIVDLTRGAPVVTSPSDPSGGAGDLFCAGHAILPDGRVLAAGGSVWHTAPSIQMPVAGVPDARVFDPETNEWTRVADMAFDRWYPSVLTLSDGSALAASGVENLTNPATMVEPLEVYDADADAWTELAGGDRLLPMYPRLTVVPGGPMKGDLFYNTVGTLWGPFGEHPLEALWSLQQAYDPDSEEWRYLGPSVFGARQHAASVMLPLRSDDGYSPKILTFGGTLQRSVVATPLAELADLSTDPPTNEAVAPMHNGRWHLNGVLLPDGKVLAVGGGRIDNVVVHGQENPPVLTAEIFDPATGEWTETPEMQVPRMYHSTAVLLADGRVLVGGHVPLPNPSPTLRQEIAGTGVALNPQAKETRLEIYNPPYLYRGDRPEIHRVSDADFAYGETFVVEAKVPAGLDSVVLVRPGSTTHSYDSGQRSIVLDVLRVDGDAITVRAPPDADVAPPGPYMLFVNGKHVDGAVPSVAEFVRIG